MNTKLGQTTNVSRSQNFRTCGDYGSRLFFSQRRGDFRLIQIISSSAATTKMCVRQFANLNSGNAAQKLPRFAANALSIGEVAGVMIGDFLWPAGAARSFTESKALQINTDIEHTLAKCFRASFVFGTTQ